MLKCKNEAIMLLKTKEEAWVRLPKRTANEPILRLNEAILPCESGRLYDGERKAKSEASSAAAPQSVLANQAPCGDSPPRRS